ncbi:MAG: galactose-1-phosphate uridylyltransferase [Candidatus Firestonebacteria bacterium]
MSELRWNPMLDEWVITATHRQERTFFPPKDFCPLCPTKKGKFPTEIPAETYEIAVFENKFPSLQKTAPVPAVKGDDFYKVKKARGICEVVVYTKEHDTTLAKQPVDEVYKLIKVWKDRYKELGEQKFIKYVYIFENKGEIIGVTLPHPHGQIYAFPFIPPKVEIELKAAKKYYHKNKKCLYCDILKKERKFKQRIVGENAGFTAFIPFYAKYPYEVHIMSKKHKSSLLDFSERDMKNLSTMLKTILVKYDKLFNFSFPYIMLMHQAPTDGKLHKEIHWHIEFYPPYRTEKKVKYLAGCEAGAGSFINDTLAEEKAAELRKIKTKR